MQACGHDALGFETQIARFSRSNRTQHVAVEKWTDRREAYTHVEMRWELPLSLCTLPAPQHTPAELMSKRPAYPLNKKNMRSPEGGVGGGHRVLPATLYRLHRSALRTTCVASPEVTTLRWGKRIGVPWESLAYCVWSKERLYCLLLLCPRQEATAVSYLLRLQPFRGMHGRSSPWKLW